MRRLRSRRLQGSSPDEVPSQRESNVERPFQSPRPNTGFGPHFGLLSNQVRQLLSLHIRPAASGRSLVGNRLVVSGLPELTDGEWLAQRANAAHVQQVYALTTLRS